MFLIIADINPDIQFGLSPIPVICQSFRAFPQDEVIGLLRGYRYAGGEGFLKIFVLVEIGVENDFLPPEVQCLLLGEMLGIAFMLERLFPDGLWDGNQLEIIAGSLLVVAAEEFDGRFEVHLPGV